MRKLVAIAKGYFGGRIVEPGEIVAWPHENTPGWLVEKAKPADVEAAPDGEDEPAPAPAKAKGKGRKGGETIAAPTAEPFGDAPAPVMAGNGVVEVLGGPGPDWIAPKPVDD